MPPKLKAKQPIKRRCILIEEDLTQTQKFLILLTLVGFLLWRAVSFYHQEVEYAQPDHPLHEHHSDASANKRAYLAAAIFMSLWFFYSTFFIERVYKKYGRGNTEKKVQQKQTPGQFGKLTKKQEHFRRMDMINPKLPNPTKEKATSIFHTPVTALPPNVLSVMPQAMPVVHFNEWKFFEEIYMEIPKGFHEAAAIIRKHEGLQK